MRGFPLVKAARAVGWCPSFTPLESWHWWRWWTAGTSTTTGGGLCLRPDPRVPKPATTPQRRVYQLSAGRQVLFDEGAGHVLGAVRGLSVAFGGGDDGALHQDVARPGEAVGVAQTGGFGALAQDRADVAQVLDAGLSGWVSGAQLGQHIDE